MTTFVLACILAPYFVIAVDRGWAQDSFRETWFMVRHPLLWWRRLFVDATARSKRQP